MCAGSLLDLLSLAERQYNAMRRECDSLGIVPLPGALDTGDGGTPGLLSLSLMTDVSRLTEQALSLWASSGALPDTDVLQLWCQSMADSQAGSICTLYSLQHSIAIAVLISRGEIDSAYHALNGTIPGETEQSISRNTSQRMPTRPVLTDFTTPDAPMINVPQDTSVAALRGGPRIRKPKKKKKSGKTSKKKKAKTKGR